MWCRVLLVVIALTCTFQREIIAEPDDVICVILLSGLQKEDLDVNLLEKLQRHNVNIDDMNNEKTIEKCLLSATSESPKENGALSAEKQVPTISPESHRRDKIPRVRPSIQNLVKLWKLLNDTQSQQEEDAVIIRKYMDLSTPATDTNVESQKKDLNYINKLFKKYIAAKREQMTTETPITNQKHYDAISQQVKEFLEHSNLYYNKADLSSKPIENGNGYAYRLLDDDDTLLGKERKKEVTKINLTMQMPYTVKKETDTESRSKDLSDINKIFEKYIAAKHTYTTTQKPTTTQKHIDVVSQQIKEFLENSNVHYKDTSEQSKNEHTSDYESHNTDEDFNKDAKIDFQAKDLDHINKIFNSYIAANREHTSTLKPTTTQMPIDAISQQVRQFLEDNKIFNNQASMNQVFDALVNGNPNKPNHFDEEPTLSRKSATIRYIDELLRRKNLLNKPSIPENKTKPALPVNKSQTKPKPVTQKNNKQNLVPDKMIKEIADEIKASVLKDIKKQISSSTLETATKKNIKTETTTPKVNQSKTENATTVLENLKQLFRLLKKETLVENTTQITHTNTSSQTDQDKFKEVSSALENFMELFQNFDQNKKSVVVPGRLKYTLTQRKKTKNEFHGPINVLYPSMMPVNYAYGVKAEQVSVMPILVNPYNRVVQIQTNIPKQVSRELNSKIQFHELSNFNINPLNSNGKIQIPTMQLVPIIQTDAIEVPPLGIPVSKTIRAINQNIVLLSTQQPIVKSKNERQPRNYAKGHNKDYIPRDETYNTDTISESGTDSDRRHTDVERTYGKEQAYSQHGRTAEKRKERERKLARNKPSTVVDNFYKEYLTKIKPHSNRDYVSMLSKDRKRERFHEKLEKQNDWLEKQKHYRDHHSNTSTTKNTRQDKRYDVVSRQQMSLNALKKKASSDDTHFKNFLQTQQKVNDMLEKILASKNPERARSVETPDTMNAYVK